MRALPPAEHRTILAVDVQGFGSQRRTNPNQLAVRDALYRALREAFTGVGVELDDCHHEDRGDGALVLIPPDVPKSQVIVRLPGPLADALRRHNRTCPPQERIRLRVALHAGEVNFDAHGVAGTAINRTFRLLEAEALKSALADSPGVLALIASDWFYDDVIRHVPESNPGAYRRVRVTVKETTTIGWLVLPDQPYSPPIETTAASSVRRRETAREAARRAVTAISELIPTRLPPPVSGESLDAGRSPDVKRLHLDALEWEADGERYWLDPNPLIVAQREVAVVVAEPPAAASLADVVMGLAKPAAGRVRLEERDVTGLPPGIRPVGLVPLGGGLLPHLTVERNIAYGLGRAGLPRARSTARRLRLGDVTTLRPHELSPVQRLRVAVARTLCSRHEPVAVVIEDRHGHPHCRAALATARDHDLAVLVVTDRLARGRELGGRLYTVRSNRQAVPGDGDEGDDEA
jgi:ABC-type thiamine transport system ATPase subunit